MKCPSCNTRKAIFNKQYGYTECKVCQEVNERLSIPTEFTTDSIREGRREYRADSLQPFRDGILSKEYLDTYGTLGIKPTKEELKNAKNVYGDLKGIENIEKTKKVERKR